MTTLAELRQEIATAVTVTGLVTCLPYPPDTLAPPVAWIDAVNVQWITGNPFCVASVDAVVQHVVARNDSQSALTEVEAAIPDITEALEKADITVSAVNTGTVEVSGQQLVAASYQTTSQI